METIKFYQDSNKLWHLNDVIYPAGSVMLVIFGEEKLNFQFSNGTYIFGVPVAITDVLKENDEAYSNISELLTTTKGFFVNAAQEAADNLAVRVESLEENALKFVFLDYWENNEILTETPPDLNLFAATYPDGEDPVNVLHITKLYVSVEPLEEGGNFRWIETPLSINKIYINRGTGNKFSWDAADSLMSPFTDISGKVDKEIGKALSTNDYNNEDKAKVDLLAASIENIYAYGVLIDNNFSSPSLARIGNLELHKTLPIQSNMKGCLLLDNGTVNYYLKPTDWTKKLDETASVLDGTHGQVMVEIPEYYVKYQTVNAMQFKVMISTVAMPGYTLVTKKYVSAYKASLQRSNSKLSSVINLAADFRGGNNNATYDGTSKTFLGKPATALSLDSFRTYARNRAAGTRWNCMTYEIRKSLYWLFVIEYANLNSQSAVTAKDTVTGYMQGGLGNGVTTVVSGEWNTFNAYYPLIPCGASNSLGNASGEVNYVCVDLGGAGVNRTVTANRYRGVENPFGDLSEWTDGILIDVKTDASGGTSKLYTSNDNPATFTSSVLGNYFYRGYISRTDGATKQILFGTYGDILAVNNVGAGSTTYYCDYFWKDITANAIKGVFFGGYASDGSTAGFVSAAAHDAPSGTAALFGSRLCFV
jgi:hypothetical protein